MAVDEESLASPMDDDGNSAKNLSYSELNGLTFNEKVYWKSGRGVEFGQTVRTSAGRAGVTTSRRQFCDLFWQHKLTTTTLCFVFWCFGLCVAFLGPTLLDLGCKTSTTFSTMSWVFFSQSFFILLGSACAGVLLQKFPDDIMLFVAILMMTATMAIIPVCNVLWSLAIVLALMGFFMGTIDTVANVSMISLYGKDVSPFLQTMHFFYGVGAFVSPMIAQPFLLNEDCSRFIDNTTKITIKDDNETYPAETLEDAQKKTHINYAFWTMSLFMVPVIFLSLLLVTRRCFHKLLNNENHNSFAEKQYENMGDKTAESKENLEETSQVNNGYIVLVAFLCAVLMFLYDGLQATFGGYVYSYSVKGPVKLPKYDAAYLNALFWGMFAAGRLISIVLATRVSPTIMLFGNIIGCTFGVLMILALRYNQIMLIIGTCLMGFFMSSVFPTALSLTEKYINVTPTITSVLVFSAATGEMSLPVIVGHEFERKGPISFLVISLILCFLSVITYMSLWLAGSVSTPYQEFKVVQWWNSCMSRQKLGKEETELMNQQVLYYSQMHSDLSDNSLADQDASIMRSELVLKD
ncbi:major facilitator superfamily domain-containing protein 4A-like [Centruroides sculpturatus]|uniref:major facilitator superfamily domain-containing protein 4A-like n=1 Tax=Centruroides sculpturatus TaxID=218467 RepID=UPI000C6D39E5|nr:major facilitator superfamily domain-containing protein 4A-like [Centruroides sculpturatus]